MSGDQPHARQHLLILGALGVVFGDIGTSPLYALQECLTGDHGVPPTPDNVLGVLSLFFWALALVITGKYLAFMMRADNRGEGGIMALLALVPERLRAQPPGHIGALGLLVMAGAALLFGDGIITPSISVLSALEGLEVATPVLKPFILPATCGILIGLFLLQSRGTGPIGALFGPVMLVWFVVLAAMGTYHIVASGPAVFAALSPHHAVRFFIEHGGHGFRLLGSVVLAVTGGEALYADMGHFGRRPIQRAWLLVVWPGLLLCYFGQGALLLRDPKAAEMLFYSMVPRGGALSMALVILATCATIIASQALISGVFSLTQQAIRLGYFPRLTVRHTSDQTAGQIYVPLMNWGLMVSCIALVLIFGKASKLAAAYGLAVSGTMGITSILFYIVARYTWGWSPLKAGGLLAVLLVIDLSFFGATLLKFFDGGYVPVVVAVALVLVMATWRIGRSYLAQRSLAVSPPEAAFLASLPDLLKCRVPGAAAFMASYPTGIPESLSRMVRSFKVVHETVLLLTVITDDRPRVPEDERIEARDLGQGFYRVQVRYGFIEDYHLPAALARAIERLGLPVSADEVTYILGHESFAATERGQMGALSEGLFAFLSRNARNATDYFGIPPERVLELGARLDL